MSVTAAGSMGQSLGFAWTVLRASRTAFIGQATGLIWTLGLGLLVFLVSSESSALGLDTKAEQVAFLALVWGPMTLGFLVAHGLRALSKSAPMAVLPSLKRRATHAVVGFAVIAALFGAAVAGFLQVYGALNGAVYAFGSYIVVFGLLIPGRLDFLSASLLLLIGFLGRAEIVGIVQGTEMPTLGESLLTFTVFLLALPVALWLFSPLEIAVEEQGKDDRPQARRGRSGQVELAPAPADSTGARFQRAARFARQSLGLRVRLKATFNALVMVAAPVLLFFAFVYFFKGGKMPSAALTCQLLFIMLLLPVIGSTQQHVGVPSAAMSRETLATLCFRRLLGYAGLWVAAVAVVAGLLAGALALAADGAFRDLSFVLPIASMYVLPALPWAIALGLLVQSSRFIRKWSLPGLEAMGSVAGPAIAQTILVFVVLFASKHAASLLGGSGPSKVFWLVSALAFAGGLLALRAAFRRYYAGASLEPAAA